MNLFSYGGKRAKRKALSKKDIIVFTISYFVNWLVKKGIIRKACALTVCASIVAVILANGVAFDDNGNKGLDDLDQVVLNQAIEIVEDLHTSNPELFATETPEVIHIESSLIHFDSAPPKINDEKDTAPATPVSKAPSSQVTNQPEVQVTEIPEVVELTNEEKVEYILEKFNLTKEEFTIIVAIVIAEAKPNSYADAYAVINTVYNRTKSYRWSSYIDKITGPGAGTSLYLQMISEDQFEAYWNGDYLKFIGNTELPAYQAVIDFLYTLDIMHNYMSFYASFGETKGDQPFVSWGNIYHDEMSPEDTMPDDVDRSESSDVLKRVLVK